MSDKTGGPATGVGFRDWSDYPTGTKAHASTGGHWEKIARGWKWCTGSVFPTPGGDVICIQTPADAMLSERNKGE